MNAKKAWLINLFLAMGMGLSWWLAGALQSRAHAAGGSWETDGILVNTTESDNERLVIVDTEKKQLMVYRTDGVGQFRLVSARNYRYDVEFEDTSKINSIEKRTDGTYLYMYELYQQKPKP
jgi:hypothetical protein